MAAGPLALLVAASAITSCGGSPTSPSPVQAGPPPPPPKVVVISVDGMRPDALSMDTTPNIMGLLQRGASTLGAQTIYPPITLPSHGSMLSGFPPAAHGLTWNDYVPQNGNIRVPTIFSAAHAAGFRTVLVAGKSKFQHFNLPGTIDSFCLGANDSDVGAQAVGQAQAFDLMFVHLPETDLNGHASGWMSPAYMRALRNADQVVGQIVGAVPAQTTVIVTADHGGINRNHGANQPVDMTIPWIVAGPDVVQGYQVGGFVSTMDTAATALHALGLSLPAGAAGRPITEVFRSQMASSRRFKRAA